MSGTVVVFKERDYRHEMVPLVPTATVTHPLKAAVVTEGKMTRQGGKQLPVASSASSKSSSRTGSPTRRTSDPSANFCFDPLAASSAAAPTPIIDPLSNHSTLAPIGTSSTPSGIGATISTGVPNSQTVSPGLGLEPWSARRTTILASYTTTEKLTIVSSFLTTQAGEQVRVVNYRSNMTASTGGAETVMEKVKSRLEQLDSYGEGSVTETSNLSQNDFINKMSELDRALHLAWDEDQRVRTLQIVIQCAKLLSDTAALSFYPSKFVLITDLLDTFANLVYDRLKMKSASQGTGGKMTIPLPDNFKPHQVPEVAKETARNWFYKVASIRELISRLYVEAALLASYRFTDPDEIAPALLRLTGMCRGIADPLAAIYARSYLARVGMSVLPGYKQYLHQAFEDFLGTMSQLNEVTVTRRLEAESVDRAIYRTLYSPALDWLLQCLCAGTPESQLDQFMTQCENTRNPILIHSALSSFPPGYIGARAVLFADLIGQVKEPDYPRALLYRQLGACLVLSPPPNPDDRLPILNEVWRIVSQIQTPSDYVACADAWAEFIAKNFGRRQLAVFLSDLTRHVVPDRAFEQLYSQLQSILSKILTHVTDFQVLFELEDFMRFLDVFEREHVKLEVYRNILESVLRGQLGVGPGASYVTISDPVVIDACLRLLKAMHDSLTSLSVEDERRAVSRLAVGLISRIDLGLTQFERELDLLTTCRGALATLDPVLEHLVTRVNRLAMRVHATRGASGHTARSGGFVRACVAFSFITVPSMADPAAQFRLYLSTAQVALVNGCLGQADACLRSSITLLMSSPSSGTSVKVSGSGSSFTDASLLELTSALMATLLATPDNVVSGSGSLYLVKGLLNALQAHSWDPSSDTKYVLFLKVLSLLAALRQPHYLYRAGTTDANDRLYGADPAFLADLDTIAGTVTEQLFSHLEGELSTARRADLALKMAQTLLHHGDVAQSETRRLVTQLWSMAQVKGGPGKAEGAVFGLLAGWARDSKCPHREWAASLVNAVSS